jgi:hypothetical protein
LDAVSDRVGIVEVVGPIGDPHLLRAGDQLVFGRGPKADLSVGEDPWLSRRAGEIAVLASGVRVANLSSKHALNVRVNDDTVRLPVISGGSGDIGCFLVSGTAIVGTSVMIDQDRAVRLILPSTWPGTPLRLEPPLPPDEQYTTQLPLRLDIYTKEFMVAFVLCRPWFRDRTRMAPLPSAPQIAEEALKITGAHHLLHDFPGSVVRDRLAQQVHDHLKGLRVKIRRRQLVRPGLQVPLSVIASTLLHYDVIGPPHLGLLQNREWLSAQEDKWWGAE